MARDEAPPHLLPSIYEAGADPDLWPPALDALAAHLGATAAALATHHFTARAGTIYRAAGYDPECLRSYARHWAARNPWLGCDADYRPAGRIVAGPEIVPEAELVASAFYKQWLRPQGFHHRLCAVLRRDGGGAIYVAAMRPRTAPPFGPEEAARLGALVPHLQRAVELHRRIAVLRLERGLAREALDRLPTGVLFVDERGAVLALNQRAREMVEAGGGLALCAGTLRAAAGEDETRRLHRLVADAAATADGRGAAGGVLALPRGRGRHPLQVLVAPMQGGREPLGPRRTVAAVFVGDPDAPACADGERLCRLYGLTRVEAQLAMRIAQGQCVEDAAAALRIAVNTARVYLKRVFKKTGVNRQPELVRLILLGPVQLRRE